MNFQGPFLHWIFESWATATCDRPREISCCLSCLWFDELARSFWHADYFYWSNISQHKRSWRSPDHPGGMDAAPLVRPRGWGCTGGPVMLLRRRGAKPRRGEELARSHAKQDLSPKSPKPGTVPLSGFPSELVGSIRLTFQCLQISTGVTQKSPFKSKYARKLS